MSKRKTTQERWQRVKEIFNAALEREPDERAAFLDEACSDDELRAEVESLLSAHEESGSFLDSPAYEEAAGMIAESEAESVAGWMIGSYKVLALLGVGGMGEVYLAQDTRLGRKVALKMLPPNVMKSQKATHRLLREAQTASMLNHPNIVTIHALESAEGLDFIVMEYVEGETLKAIVERGPLEFQRALDLGSQAGSALAAAHAAGLIHRDIKLSNILITPRGEAKVLDFGLAKLIRPSFDGMETEIAIGGDLTDTGVIVGTVFYMSPEQTRGEPLDARSDIFSLGCVLYEAATGRLPFNGSSSLAVMNEIRISDPLPPTAIKPELPRQFDSIIRRALAKDREQRYDSALELVEELNGLMSKERGEATSEKEKRKAVSRTMVIASIAALIIAAIGVWMYWRAANREWAKSSIPRIEEMAREERYAEAYDLALRVREYLPNDPTLMHLMPMVTDDLSITSEPEGARVYLKRFTRDERGQSPERRLIGTTPIANLQIARDEYIIEIEKDGYAPLRRSVSSTLDRVQRSVMDHSAIRREVKMVEKEGGQAILFDSHAPIRIKAKLIPAAEAPDRSAFVPGGEYGLISYGKPTDAAAKLDDYFIDRYEVSNREYKEFINAGGYVKRQYWKYPFRKDGRELSWEEAVEHFKDRTGLAGPRNWSNQNFPEGKQDHPVTDVTWYEAAAFAEFRGKRLPTVFQWEKAARNGNFTVTHWLIMPWGLSSARERIEDRANFLGSGTVPVDALEFGMSVYGCYQMAGNVAEWCLNEQASGYATAGGSWKDPHYLFASFGAFPPFYSASTLGFRCVLNYPQATGDQGAMRLNPAEEIPTYTPTSEAQFQAMLRHYQYDRTPLDARIEEVTETEAWRREKISYAGAGRERAFAWLYLPKNVQPPAQVIHYVPSDAVYYGLTVPEEVEAHAAPYIKAGRAVFAVVLKGYRERPRESDSPAPKGDSVKYREQVVNWATDHRRGLDYLITRSEIDSNRIACYGVSVNPRKLTLIAIEPRYASVILMGAGLMKSWSNMIPETHGANFAPHIRAPKLMIQGRYDEAVPYKTEAEPLYNLLGEPKQLILFDQGHIPPLEVSVPIINGWLDKTIGPVRR